MPDASIGLILTRDIAEFEARTARHECIEPEHLFIGLCSLEKMLHPEVQRQLRLPNEVVQVVTGRVRNAAGAVCPVRYSPHDPP